VFTNAEAVDVDECCTCNDSPKDRDNGFIVMKILRSPLCLYM
jgi:hypothetical protein